ncbi:MAG TPA: serine/threonine-protein kinase [Polyangiaceae bacterium]|nr:serine/threonine-protein kinase [Polyangiaceae bacterium]
MTGVHGRGDAAPADGARGDVALLDVSAAWDAADALRDAARRELPLDVRRAAVAGLGAACLAGAGVIATYLVVFGLANADDGSLSSALGRVKPLFAAGLLCAAMAAVTRLPAKNPDVVLRLGLVHYIVVALLLGVTRHAEAWPALQAARAWSPVGVWILLFGALVPLRPITVFGWSLLAAMMDPFALLAVHANRAPVSSVERLLLSLSPFCAALVAFATSSVIYGLTERIEKARKFGSYRLVQRLGTGGMAEVWRADHRMLARPAAVKLIRPGVLSNYGEKESARLVRLFEREVQATAALRSPHTIQVYDFGVARDGTFYYVMELLDGFDLQTLVERFGKQPPERVVFVLRQVCHSLHEAHARQFVHRDMKPGNIYVCRYGADLDFAKVLDFGLVLDRRPTAEELDERRGQVGTPAIMAPEQVRFDAPVDQRTDIYAIGCVAYWLLTGERVFEAETRHDMLVMHAHQRPVRPSRRGHKDVPESLEELVMACLDKNPNKRPQTARELSEQLGGLGLEGAWDAEKREQWWRANLGER